MTSLIRPGLKYERLLVLRRNGSVRGQSQWRCRCDCGVEIDVKGFDLTKGRRRSCGCLKHGPDSSSWKGTGEISASFWRDIQRGASGEKGGRTPREFTITAEWAWRLFLAQERRCALSGMTLRLYPEDERTASLDRIDSAMGYVPENVQWVHKRVNIMKNVTSQSEFVAMCMAVADFHRTGGKCEVDWDALMRQAEAMEAGAAK